MSITVAVWGASGRLGSVICEVIDGLEGFKIIAKPTRDSSPESDSDAEIVVDATEITASKRIVYRAIQRGQKILLGTSGWLAHDLEELREHLKSFPQSAVLHVPNFSLGSVLQTELSKTVAKFYDSIEIIEAHHEKKIDSPSGTAVATALGIAEARNAKTVEAPHSDQEARGQVVSGVPIHSLRLRGVLANQKVIFGGPGETLTIEHDTLSSSAYSQGIIVALQSLPKLTGLVSGLASLLGVTEAESHEG